MSSGEDSALHEAIALAMRIIRCAEEIVRERPTISRRELIERLSDVFLDHDLIGRDAGSRSAR